MKVAILSLAIAVFAGPSQAGMALICMDRFELEAALIDWYRAAPLVEAKRGDESIQIWITADQETWAMIRHHRSGRSCVLQTGDQRQDPSKILDTMM